MRMWKANIFLTAMCFCASLLLLSWPTPPCVLSFSLSTLFLSHLSFLFLSSFHNFCHLFPSHLPPFQIFPFFSTSSSPTPAAFFPPFVPIPLLSHYLLSHPSFPSPSLSFISLHIPHSSPTFSLFSPTLLMSPIFPPKWEFPIGWWTPDKQPLCNSCP